MIKRVHHVAIVVKDLDEALAAYERIFDFKPSIVKDTPEHHLRTALIPVGDTEVELVQPTDKESGVAKFLRTRGEGVHHICLEVDDIDKALETMASRGVRLIDKKGQQGLAGIVAFLHPKSTRGILFELAQVE